MLISTALAATAEHAADAAGHAAGGHHGPFYSLPEFWVAVAFFAVVFFAFRPVGKALCAGLDMRRAKIKARLEDAARLREEAQEKLVSFQRKQRTAMKEAEQIVVHARAEAERLAEQHRRDLEEALKRREQQALERIAQAEAQALKEVREAAVDVAISATRRLITQSLNAKQAASLVDAAIKDLPNRLH